jgi:2-keto-3-deoxy-L-rhamnonate aldolase RhmA
MRENAIRTALHEGRVPLGIQSFAGGRAMLEIIGRAGFDFVMIDTEHTCVGSERVETLVRACDSVELMALVRVAENSPMHIRKALEARARGVFIPQVRTAADIEQAIAAARYPPAGTRGVCPSPRSSGYSLAEWNEYVRWTNDDVLVIPALEHPEAIENAEAICRVDGVEIVSLGPCYVGPAVGSADRGMDLAEVRAALDHVLQVAAQTETHVLMVPFPDLSPGACRDLIDRGVHVLMHSVDEVLFFQTCRDIVATLAPGLRLPTPPNSDVTHHRLPAGDSSGGNHR